jgi:hypothetical protein
LTTTLHVSGRNLKIVGNFSGLGRFYKEQLFKRNNKQSLLSKEKKMNLERIVFGTVLFVPFLLRYKKTEFCGIH